MQVCWQVGLLFLMIICSQDKYNTVLGLNYFILQLDMTHCITLTIDIIFIPLRHILAAVHFNFNLHRECRKKAGDTGQMKVSYPKFKNGEAIVRNVRVSQNFGESVCKFLIIIRYRTYSAISRAIFTQILTKSGTI